MHACVSRPVAPTDAEPEAITVHDMCHGRAPPAARSDERNSRRSVSAAFRRTMTAAKRRAARRCGTDRDVGSIPSADSLLVARQRKRELEAYGANGSRAGACRGQRESSCSRAAATSLAFTDALESAAITDALPSAHSCRDCKHLLSLLRGACTIQRPACDVHTHCWPTKRGEPGAHPRAMYAPAGTHPHRRPCQLVAMVSRITWRSAGERMTDLRRVRTGATVCRDKFLRTASHKTSRKRKDSPTPGMRELTLSVGPSGRVTDDGDAGRLHSDAPGPHTHIARGSCKPQAGI
jgi:hypothetical protein